MTRRPWARDRAAMSARPAGILAGAGWGRGCPAVAGGAGGGGGGGVAARPGGVRGGVGGGGFLVVVVDPPHHDPGGAPGRGDPAGVDPLGGGLAVDFFVPAEKNAVAADP